MRATSKKLLALGILALGCVMASSSHADAGRTQGTFGVNPSGAATYTIPVWTPTGPGGIEPELSITYNSQASTSTMGMGWTLSGLSAIERCGSTHAEDGANRGVMLDNEDRFCLNGNKLRITSGPLSSYGTAGSEYQTQIATFERVTAMGSLGSGPQWFKVESKDGRIYEYGNSPDSRVNLGATTVYSWLLNKVRDRDGNSYVVEYSNSASTGTVPATIMWSPTAAGGTSYQYRILFGYTFKNNDKDNVYAYANGLSVLNKNRLDSIAVGYSANGTTYATKRLYLMEYELSAQTSLTRLKKITECADANAQNCLAPTTITYQNGQAGVSPTPRPGVSSSTNAQPGRFDFNGDGRSDLVFLSGSTWRVAFSIGSGFATPLDTGITGTPLIGRFVSSSQDGFLWDVSGVWRYVGYNGSTFTTSTTPIPVSAGTILSDNNGDGLTDLIWTELVAPEGRIKLRLNTTTGGAAAPTFSTTPYDVFSMSPTVSGGYVGNFTLIAISKCPLERQCDINGDGRPDLSAVATTVHSCGGPSGCGVVNNSYDMLSWGSGYAAINSTGVFTPAFTGIRFNDDRCLDKWVSGATLRVSQCNNSLGTSIALPAVPALFMDWDGDRKTDLLVNNGGTFGVYLSQGSTTAPFSALVTTSVPFQANCSYSVMDMDGDGLDDLQCISATSPFPITYNEHAGGGSAGSAGSPTTFATQTPDVVASITDGFGMSAVPSYVSIAQSNYTKGTGTAWPLTDHIEPTIVVAKVELSDGVGSTYTQTYNYKGARRNGPRGPLIKVGDGPFGEPRIMPAGEWAGFEEISITDSRTGQTRRLVYDQLFPRNGMIKRNELYQSDQTTLISRAEYTNVPQQIDAGGNFGYTSRYFPHASSATTSIYEVGGPKDGELISETAESFGYSAFTYGNMTTYVSVRTDKDSAAPQSPFLDKTWTQTLSTTFAPPDTANWCVALPIESQVSYTSTAVGASAVTRSVQFTPDSANPAKCRTKAMITEPASAKYRVTETYDFDDFGNVSSKTVVGRERDGSGSYVDMAPRTSSTNWGATGQFATFETNAMGESASSSYDYGAATLQKVSDASSTAENPIDVTFLYDDFGRRTRETRPDGTYTGWTYTNCAPSCLYPTHVLTIKETKYDKFGAEVTDQFTYLDSFERPIVIRTRLVNGEVWDGSYQWQETEYDAQGRVIKQYMPCVTAAPLTSCRTHAVTNEYDDANRVVQITRPRSSTDLSTQSTSYEYAGRILTIADAYGKQSSRLVDVNGSMRQTKDANGFAVSFTYDAFGSLLGTTSSKPATLLSNVTVEYGKAPYQIAATDSALGQVQRTYNSLGELVSWTDGKGQQFSATYDSISRPLTRTEPDTSTMWTWGSSVASFNVGKLQQVSTTSAGSTYVETYGYDSRGRLAIKTITIPSDGSYHYEYAYDVNNGWLDTLTYPLTNGGYRLKLKYSYQNGALNGIADANAPSTVFWTALSTNAWGQLTSERLGSDIITSRTMDPVTSWLTSIQAGVNGNPTSIQSSSYLYDLVGNVTQRQNNKLGLTETFIYGSGTDNLYRLSESTLNSGSGATTNLLLTYDVSGSIETKSEPLLSPLTAQTISWTSYNYPAQIAAGGETVDFSYQHDRKRWRMGLNNGGSIETTYYIGDRLEKITVGSTSEYRHSIESATGTVALLTRDNSGTNVLRYVIRDHQGSVEYFAASSGSAVEPASFTAFGERRNANTWAGPATNAGALSAISRQGYTYQTALAAMGMNHMNGRVQDAMTGRFLSPDPYIAEPVDTQSYNRYAYVQNNPVTLVDPSGFNPAPPGSNSVTPNSSCYGSGGACTASASANFADTVADDILVQAKRVQTGCDTACQRNAFNQANIADLRGRFTPTVVFPPTTMPVPTKPYMESRGERNQQGKNPNPTKGVRPVRDKSGKIIGWTVPDNQTGNRIPKTLDWGKQNGLNPDDPKWNKPPPKPKSEDDKQTETTTNTGGSTTPTTEPTSTSRVGWVIGGVVVVGAVVCAILEPCGAAVLAVGAGGGAAAAAAAQ
jgi:RHS repeat-associated protein